MNWFRNLKARTKLVASFLFLAAMLGSVSAIAVVQMRAIGGNVEATYNGNLLPLSSIKETNILLSDIGRETLWAVLQTDPAAIGASRKAIDEHVREFQGELAKVAETSDTAFEKPLVAEIKDDFAAYTARVDEAVKLAAEGKKDEACRAAAVVKAMADEMDQDYVDLARFNEKEALQTHEASEALCAGALRLVSGLVAVGVLVAFVFGWLIARSLGNALAKTVRVLKTVAAGDFTAGLEIDTKDEVGQMAGALNEAIESIRAALQETRAVADGLAAAAQQLSSASEEISSGAQEQACSLEETASSLEEITATVRQNADNAQQANQLAAGAREVAEKGGRVVGDAVRGMAEINTASKKIADIITAIDEIAFQTNLLALNAAVEAARAGEQGRGFAVVAGEVRNLAQRSAAAAKEIKGLIQDSVRKVETGSDLVNQSGRSLEEIVGAVKRVTDIVSEIAAASREQTSGIEQVNKAVTQMDQVTQANASQTEELSGTAEGLASQAERLQTLVARFKLEEGSQRPAATACAAPAQAAATGKKPAAKKPLTPVHPKPPVFPNHEVSASQEEPLAQLELAGAGAGRNGHGGFEEF
ncbi:MAG: MCP four helix bundle domain-containing protein [Pirellulales bacterium]|nr:MCP four helix bundle domain-containing protein [Pirellulales bacterium]